MAVASNIHIVSSALRAHNELRYFSYDVFANNNTSIRQENDVHWAWFTS